MTSERPWTSSGNGLLSPVWSNTSAADLLNESAVLGVLIDLEVAWAHVVESAGLVPAGSAAIVGTASETGFDLAAIARESAAGGNPVIPLVNRLRAAASIDGEAARAVHLGLTSQDVLDSALMVLARRAITQVLDQLATTATALAGRAVQHRTTPQVARSLTQHALPYTFGLKAAHWLQGISHARTLLGALRFPVQCGGAAGSSASLLALGADPDSLAADWAERISLDTSIAPWHTFRGPVTDIGHALVTTCAAAGRIANDVLLLSRPEIAELGEASGGGSSAMPQKRNPTRSVLIHSAAIAAPQHAAQLDLAAALAADERTGGAWHSEWPALIELLRLALGAATTLAELVSGLQVFPDRMRANLDLTGPLLVSERIMITLAPLVGRASVQQAIDEALAAPTSDRAATLQASLRARVSPDRLSAQELEELLDPAGYLGNAPELVDRIIAAEQTTRAMP